MRLKRTVLSLLTAALLWATPALALTTYYVNTNSSVGGDCTTNSTSGSTRACATLRDAIDLLPGTLTDSVLILVDGTNADTGNVNQTPWDMITSATNYLTVRANTASEHHGIWSTSKYRLQCTNRNCLYNNIPSHIRFENFQVEAIVNDGGGYVAVKTANANQTAGDSDNRISGMYVKCTQTSGTYTGFDTRPCAGGCGGTSRVWNSIAEGCQNGFTNDFVTGEFYNNTAVGCTYGYVDNASMKAVNNIAYNSSIGFVGSFAAGSNYNAENDGNGGPGANHRSGVAFTFVGGGDYHLASGDLGAKDFGTSNPGSGLFSDDVDGQARPIGSSWDIGFDEQGTPASGSPRGLSLLGAGS